MSYEGRARLAAVAAVADGALCQVFLRQRPQPAEMFVVDPLRGLRLDGYPSVQDKVDFVAGSCPPKGELSPRPAIADPGAQLAKQNVPKTCQSPQAPAPTAGAAATNRVAVEWHPEPWKSS